MYLIKKITLNRMNNSFQVKDGISCGLINDKLVPQWSYWGKSEVITGQFTDWERIKKTKCDECLLSYCNEIIVEDIDDGFKKFLFNVSLPNKVEGYIVFIEHSIDKIPTTGTKLFGRYYNEGIFLLKNGENLVFDGHTIKVVDGELYISI